MSLSLLGLQVTRANLCRPPARTIFSIMDPVSVQVGSMSHAQPPVRCSHVGALHAQHTDEMDSHRWTAKECHQYFEDQPWDEVLKFYSLVAAGKLSLSDLTFCEQSKYAGSQKIGSANDRELSVPQMSDGSRKQLRGGRWDRRNYKIVISYNGSAFTGWQKQPGLYTVQGVLEQALGGFSTGKRVSSLKMEGLCVDATIVVAGRTDKGVHAAGQVCSFCESYHRQLGLC